MNSPFLHEQARRLAAVVGLQARRVRPASSGSLADPAEGVRRLYLRALGRPPEADELALGIEFVQPSNGHECGRDRQMERDCRPANGEPLLSPWEQLAQVLLLTNEFMFVD